MGMDFHLAQINISRLIAPTDDPRIADFVAQLDPINALAESAPGSSGDCNPVPETPRTSRTAKIL
jgi:hypothetical protein